MSENYSAILSDTVANLGGVEIHQPFNYNSTYFVLAGIPYRFEITPRNLNNFELGEVNGLSLVTVILPSKKDFYLLVKKAYKDALKSYLIDVFNKRNAEYLDEPLKAYLFNYILTVGEQRR